MMFSLHPAVLQVNDVKVDFAHHENHNTYTVEAKAGDFIIGEVGRINVNNGQTLEVSLFKSVLSISFVFLPGSEVHSSGWGGVPGQDIPGTLLWSTPKLTIYFQILARFFGTKSRQR